MDDAFSQARKDAALWAKSTKEADDALRDVCGDVWKNAPKAERDAIYGYTSSYSKINEPLRGIEYGTNTFKGVGNIDFNTIGTNYGGHKRGQVRKQINAMTDIIENPPMILIYGCSVVVITGAWITSLKYLCQIYRTQHRQNWNGCCWVKPLLITDFQLRRFQRKGLFT